MPRYIPVRDGLDVGVQLDGYEEGNKVGALDGLAVGTAEGSYSVRKMYTKRTIWSKYILQYHAQIYKYSPDLTASVFSHIHLEVGTTEREHVGLYDGSIVGAIETGAGDGAVGPALGAKVGPVGMNATPARNLSFGIAHHLKYRSLLYGIITNTRLLLVVVSTYAG